MSITSFNRTFMELKFTLLRQSTDQLLCFNRTFMELKFYDQCIDEHINQ